MGLWCAQNVVIVASSPRLQPLKLARSVISISLDRVFEFEKTTTSLPASKALCKEGKTNDVDLPQAG
eukprot:2321524-Amphidinium_carterae.1